MLTLVSSPNLVSLCFTLRGSRTLAHSFVLPVTHNTMRGLSGGQKVKVVLGAATWRRPHVVILDEPTNFLDRESLAALIAALKVFEGGVLVITHNREFSESICSEVWAMADGRLVASGHNWVEGQGSGARIDKKPDEEEEKFDAMARRFLKPQC